ncbi:MAG TPA: cysteine hydrolase family protein [Thermoanaerobaculia bacterium]|nr:cysteine hydrolase family protein [Thermoanaerobaculia bacterium]
MAQPAPIEQSALLVIDIQDSFKLGPRWERRNNPDFEKNVDRLLQSWRAAGLPVFFILHTDPDPGFERDSPLVKVMDFLSPRENEPVILKDTRNAFTSTDLQKRLDEKGVKRVVITGISTEQCCETTTRVAADLGYDVDFVTEATRTFPIALPDGSELSTDEIVRRTEAVLRNRFARIARVDELVGELERAALPCNG